VSIYGITRIQINDNPVKWFSKSHPIRQADIELNSHFGGTYMAYLVLEDAAKGNINTEFVDSLRSRWLKKGSELTEEITQAKDLVGEVEKLLISRASDKKSRQQYVDEFIEIANKKIETAEKSGQDTAIDLWYEIADFFELEKERLKLFKQPQVLNYISRLQTHLKESGLVGKSNSVADVVKKVHQELIDGKSESYIIPKSSSAVAQCLMQF